TTSLIPLPSTTLFRSRQKLTTPSTRDPARNGTVISEWMPYSTTCAVRSRSCACQPGAAPRSGSSTACPECRLRACGEESTNLIRSEEHTSELQSLAYL